MKNRIEAVLIDSKDGKAKLKLTRHSDCSNCGACAGQDVIMMDAENSIDAKRGQNVEVEVKEQNVLKSAFIVFILPLLAIFIGAVLGFYVSHLLHRSETPWEITGGIVFFLFSVLYIKHVDKLIKSRQDLPRIIRILP